MPELFEETKSRLFTVLCQLINEVHQGRSYNRQQLIDRMKECLGFHYDPKDICNADAETERDLIDTMFLFSQSKEALLLIDAPVPIQPTSIELKWLKAMLLDDTFNWLLPDDLRQKLLTRLDGIHPLIRQDQWHRIQADGDMPTADLNQQLALIQTAFQQQVKIHYINQAVDGTIYEKDAIPCRLEYDLAANHYSLIIWSEEESRAIKLNLASLQELNLTETPIPDEISGQLEAFYAKAPKETIKLRLKNTYNAVQRCFALFASYDKSSIVDDDLQTYELDIQYYRFDRPEIMQRILSLGPAATVLSPPEARQEICDIMAAAQQRYL
ncbi:MAG: WYL domain-containing protein [Selenomonas sp.]|jgi:predicted DNA-binding transcriptional regulator YafY|nr:WYL domain-containing protein [Selenomonas sp.]